MDFGKSCVRFKKLEDLPLDLIGRCIAYDSVEEFAAKVQAVQSVRKVRTTARRKR